jgi:hypothetical protein
VVNNGSGTGAFYSNSELTITADAAPAGQEFDEWVIISGNPTIADINAATTTLTMPIDGAEITATYKEAEVSVGQYTSQEQSVNIYPNPLSGRILSIDLLGFDAKDRIDVKITNLMGQTIYSNSIQKGDHLEIDANSLFKNGIYLVNVKSGQSIVTKKLIVE